MATKLQYHKIKNVPLEVCTVEQKLAYNLAFATYFSYKQLYDMAETGVQKSEIVQDCIKECIHRWQIGNYKVKHNIDGIFCALNTGMENYLKSNNHVAWSYEQIGKMFPANYL